MNVSIITIYVTMVLVKTMKEIIHVLVILGGKEGTVQTTLMNA